MEPVLLEEPYGFVDLVVGRGYEAGHRRLMSGAEQFLDFDGSGDRRSVTVHEFQA